MDIPFTIEQFLNVFREYNQAVWPMQILFNLLAVGALLLITFRAKFANKFALGLLAFLWLWMGIVYHIYFFSEINPVANIFGAAFILQGLLLIFFIFKSQIHFQFQTDFESLLAVIVLVYALLIYPVLGYLLGHHYPASPTFGLPCPTTIFTFGLFILARRSIPFILIIIPLLWSLLGFSAAFSLGIFEDTGLIISGLLFLVLYFMKKRQNRHLAHLHFSD